MLVWMTLLHIIVFVIGTPAEDTFTTGTCHGNTMDTPPTSVTIHLGGTRHRGVLAGIRLIAMNVLTTAAPMIGTHMMEHGMMRHATIHPTAATIFTLQHSRSRMQNCLARRPIGLADSTHPR